MPLQSYYFLNGIYPPYSCENPTAQKRLVWRMGRAACPESAGCEAQRPPVQATAEPGAGMGCVSPTQRD